MATDLEVGIGVDLKELTEGLKKVSNQLTEFSTKTKKDAEKAGNSWSDGFEKMVKGYLTFEAVTRVGGAAKNLLLLEERFNALKMPLANVTQATGDYGLALGFITRLADQTGQDLFVLGDSYKNLYASAKQAGFATDEINKIFGSVVRAGSALKLSNEQVSLSLKAVEQMMNKGTISSEELKGQLGEQLPGAYGMMAKAAQDAGLSVSGSTQELGKLLEQGKVGSAQVLPFFAKRMEEAFGKNANANINTISGSANRMKNELTLLVSALDDSKVTSFWASIQNGIANTMKDLTFLIKSGSWQEFMEYTKGSIMTTGKRVGIEMQEQIFANKDPKAQLKEYVQLNKDLLWHMNMVDKSLKAGGNPVTDQIVKLTDQVKRYKAIMGGGGSGGSTPPLIPPDEIKAVQDYSFEIALLDQEAKVSLSNIQTYWEDIFRTQNAILGGMDIKKLAPMMNGVNPLSEQGAKDKDLISQLFGGDLTQSTANLQARLEGLQSSIQPVITNFTEKLGKFISKNFETINGAMSMGVEFLGDALATGLASIFNKDIKFDFKKMLGQFLGALGDMFLKMATPLIVGGLLMNIGLPGSGSAQLASGLKLGALGVGLKAGGIALASNSAGSSMSSTTTNARNASPFQGGQGFNGGTVNFKIQGTELVGVLNNTNQTYGG